MTSASAMADGAARGAAWARARLSGPGLVRAAGIALCLGGLVLLGLALKAPAKAALGGFLLERAWATTLADGPEARATAPWPGADFAPAGRIAFPTLGEERVILDQASGEAMAWGAGHVRGTAPLGAPGLAAVAAHRDTHFALLADLGPGEEVLVETRDGETRRYVIETARVVDARVWRFPLLHEGPEILALMTCWPIDALQSGHERLVLFARRAERGAS